MLSNRLKLNPGKTQLIWIGTWQQLKKFPSLVLFLLLTTLITLRQFYVTSCIGYHSAFALYTKLL